MKLLNNVLKIKIFQETACYKKPFALKVAETYPLPPYSTVKGLFHKLIDAKEFFPFNISVQGTYECVVNNYQTMLFFKDDLNATTMPLNVNLLYNVNLIIHVFYPDEKVLTNLYDRLTAPNEYLSLGRREDLAIVTDLKFVELKLVDFEDLDEPYILKNNIYIPSGYLENLEASGINYIVNYSYELENGKRRWNKASVKYIEKGRIFESGKFYLDEEGDIAVFYPPYEVIKR